LIEKNQLGVQRDPAFVGVTIALISAGMTVYELYQLSDKAMNDEKLKEFIAYADIHGVKKAMENHDMQDIVANYHGEILGVAVAAISGPVIKGLGKMATSQLAKSIAAKLVSAGKGYLSPAYIEKYAEVVAKVSTQINKVRFNKIMNTPKGMRPDPTEYLSETYIAKHLAQFDDGAVRFMKKSQFEKYGVSQVDGTSFVMSKKEAEILISKANGKKSLYEKALGYPEGTLKNDVLIRVDIPNPKKYGARLPSGNEAGANPLWIPGGKLPNGNVEAVLDLKNISDKDFVVNILD